MFDKKTHARVCAHHGIKTDATNFKCYRKIEHTHTHTYSPHFLHYCIYFEYAYCASPVPVFYFIFQSVYLCLRNILPPTPLPRFLHFLFSLFLLFSWRISFFSFLIWHEGLAVSHETQGKKKKRGEGERRAKTRWRAYIRVTIRIVAFCAIVRRASGPRLQRCAIDFSLVRRPSMINTTRHGGICRIG